MTLQTQKLTQPKPSKFKADIYNLRNLKIVLDDAFLHYLQNQNLKLKTTFTDFEIFVGILSTILSIIVVYLSCNYEFSEYKFYLIICLSIYFFFNGIITICNYFCNITFTFDKMKVCTEINPPCPVYTILIYQNDKLIPQKWSKSVYELFGCDGCLNEKMFYKELGKFVEIESK